jgi:hypothetical protein
MAGISKIVLLLAFGVALLGIGEAFGELALNIKLYIIILFSIIGNAQDLKPHYPMLDTAHKTGSLKASSVPTKKPWSFQWFASYTRAIPLHRCPNNSKN